MSKSDDRKIATAKEIAEATGRTARWVRLMATEGRFQRVGRGHYDLLSVAAGLLAMLDEKATAQPKSDARERFDQAKAKEAEMRIAERERELIPQVEALDAMSLLVGRVSEEFNGMARRCTRDVDLQKVIEAEADGSKARISNAFGKLAGFVRDGGEPPSSV